MTLSGFLYALARGSRDVNAIRRGPKAVGKRLIRKGIGRAYARTGIPRWPR
jgi:hypothetical protein